MEKRGLGMKEERCRGRNRKGRERFEGGKEEEMKEERREEDKEEKGGKI